MLPNKQSSSRFQTIALLLAVGIVFSIGFIVTLSASQNGPPDLPENTPVPTITTAAVQSPENVEIVEQFYCKNNIIYGLIEEAETESTITIPYWCNEIAPDAFVNSDCKFLQFAPREEDCPIEWSPQENHTITQVIFPSSSIVLEEIDLTQCKELSSVSITINQPDVDKLKTILPPQIEQLSISGECTEVPELAFENFQNLNTISLPNSVKVISSEAFLNCESLTNFKVPSDCLEIAENAFSGCYSLSTVYFNDLLSTFKTDLFKDSPITDYHFPETFNSPGPILAHQLKREGETLILHAAEGSDIQSEIQNYWLQINSEIVNYDGAYFKRPAFVLISE